MRTSATPPMTIRAPGWYPDPQDLSVGAERWWTGVEWGEAGRHADDLDRAPTAPQPTPVAPAPRRRLLDRLRR